MKANKKMYDNLKKTAVIIGDNCDLLKHCITILHNNNVEVACIFSKNKSIIKVSSSHNIYTTEQIKQFFKFIRQNRADYLFSIQNSFHIPDDIIKCISKMAINYHNSLLPYYGGLYSTSWAIWYNESVSGVTWHIMSNLIDSGDILIQKEFKIERDDTAFSLELKCQEYAKNTFTELIEQLEHTDNIKKYKQNLTKRSFFTSYTRPCGFAIVDFSSTAEEIYRQFRALYFGTKKNPITIPKFKFKEQYLAINNLKLLCTKTASYPSGTIVAVQKQSIQITTSTVDILVDYQNLPYENLLIIDNTSIGTQLTGCSDLIEQQVVLAEQTAKDEPYWKHQLQIFKPGKNFIENKPMVYSTYKQVLNFNFEDLNTINPKLTIINSEVILSVLVGYLYKINDYESFSVSINGLSSNKYSNQVDKICSTILPFNFLVEDGLDYITTKNEISTFIQLIKDKNLYLKDLLLRYEENTDTVFYNSLLINFSLHAFEEESTFPYPIIINVNIMLQTISLFVAENYIHHIPFFLTFMESHLKCLTSQWVYENKKLNQINLLSEREIAYLKEWNNTTKPYPNNISISHLINNVCNNFSNNIALETCTQKITYAELNITAEKIAKNILFTMQENDLIGHKIAIFLDKSINTVITFIAILKTGAAYIVLDSTYPNEYLENIIKIGNATLYLTLPDSVDRLKGIIKVSKAHAEYRVLILNDLINNQCNNVCLPEKIPSDSLAYILFTSGSTGNPKGIMIAQNSLINFALAIIDKIGIKNNDKSLQFATLAFDTSIWEIYTTLLTGATLYIPSKNEVIIGENLQKTIINNRISLLIIAPSILNIQPYFESKYIRTIIVGGEACPDNVISTWGSNYRLINVYGPSECTVVSTISKELTAQDKVTIGTPLDNCQIMICDRYKTPCVLGSIGEIVISGTGVGKGYLNNHPLTQQKFNKINFSNNHIFEKNQIAYFSGDLGKWTKTGELLYCGRSDFQIKIGGRLIDLDTIEKVIAKFDGIHTCIVIPKAISSDNISLSAYILTISSSITLKLNALRNFLQTQLPYFMIPAKFFVIDYLPLTASGKVDRQKLLSQEWTLLIDSEAINVPITKLQHELCSIWQEIIGINNSIDIYANFFKLGGNSLQISQMIIRIINLYNKQISITDFLKLPTIKHLENMIADIGLTSNHEVEKLIKNDLTKFNQLISSSKLKTSTPPDKIKKTLIMGATGFLGAHIAKNFLENGMIVYCLINSNDPENLSNITHKFKNYGWTDTEILKLHLVYGDISKTHFGLDIKLYEELVNEIDVICNCAVVANHILHYNQLKEVNVYGVWNCIMFAYTGKRKYLLHTSTLSILNSTGLENFVNLSNCIDIHNMSGYILTKLVAELCLSNLVKSGASYVRIYRPGIIGCNSVTGVQNYDNHHLMLFIKGCLQMGVAPICDDLPINIIPVDYMSQFIVYDILNNNTNNISNIVYNIRTDELLSLQDIISYIANKIGSKIRFIPYTEWQTNLNNYGMKNAIYPLLSLYLDENSRDTIKAYSDIVSAKNTVFDSTYKKLNFRTIPAIKQQMSIGTDFLIKKGFFDD